MVAILDSRMDATLVSNISHTQDLYINVGIGVSCPKSCLDATIRFLTATEANVDKKSGMATILDSNMAAILDYNTQELLDNRRKVFLMP